MFKAPTPEEFAELRKFFESVGALVPEIPFEIREIDPTAQWLQEGHEPLPFEIASFLVQAQEVSATVEQYGCRWWEVKFAPGTQFDKLSAHFRSRILDCGGARISAFYEVDSKCSTARSRDIIVYPFNWEFGHHLLEKCGFGVDCHVQTQNGLPLEPDLNTPERVIERRRRAINFISELHAEAPIVLSSVYPEAATLRWVKQPSGIVARKWADLAWVFYTENFSAAKDSAHYSDNREAFTRVESRSKAKHGMIQLGSST